MFLAILSWQAYAIMVAGSCLFYYGFLFFKSGLLQQLNSTIPPNESLYPINKMEQTDDLPPWNNDSKSQQKDLKATSDPSIALEFHNLTDEVNALLLQAASQKLSRDILLNALIQLVRGHSFATNDKDLLKSLKEIIIVEAANICQYKYSIEELAI
ncbi:MAG: hypothetical protein QM802_03215 [Agriterribacter sp.]